MLSVWGPNQSSFSLLLPFIESGPLFNSMNFSFAADFAPCNSNGLFQHHQHLPVPVGPEHREPRFQLQLRGLLRDDDQFDDLRRRHVFGQVVGRWARLRR